MAPLDLSQGRAKPARSGGAGCAACDIRHLTFCSDQSAEAMAALQALAQPIHVAPGQPVFQEDEAARYVFNVTSGLIKLYRLLSDGRRQITGFVHDGAMIGLSRKGSYIHTAEALTEAGLCRFPVEALDALMDAHPGVRKKMLAILSGDLATVEDHKLLLGRKSAREKVASFLVMMSDLGVGRGQPARLISLPMSRLDMGDYLGLTIETVSRTVSQIKREGVIAVPDHGHIEIRDLERLRLMADGLD